VPQITEFRRDGLRRARDLYEAAIDSGKSEEVVSGLGLLVLQRAMFPVEDLGGLLLAFADQPRWRPLVDYQLTTISDLFDDLFNGGDEAIRQAYLYPTDEALAQEPGLSTAQRLALRDLRDEALRQTRERLARVAELWRLLHWQAKKTVHGLGFVAGSQVVEAPGAGRITDIVGHPESRPFVVSLETRVDDATQFANTELQTIAVDRDNVDLFLEGGLAACDACDTFAAGRLHGLETNHAFTLPQAPIEDLPCETRAVLEELFPDD
jgi:hypothetical protein